MRGLERLRMSNKLLGRADFAATCFPIGIAEEKIAREFDGIAELAPE